MTQHAIIRYGRRSIKILAWIVSCVLGLVILVLAALQFHAVQNEIGRKIASYLSDKTGTRIEIGSLNIAFIHSVVLHDIFVEGLQHDTLLFIHSAAVDVNLLQLFSHEIALTHIRIDSLNANVTRTFPDSAYNFDFILNTLNGESSGARNVPEPSASSRWKIVPNVVDLSGFHCTYDDEVSGLTINLLLGTLTASIDRFDTDALRFHVKELSIANTTAVINQTKESHPDTSVSSVVQFGFGSLSLSRVQLDYQNSAAGERYYADLGTVSILAEDINLPSHHLALKNIRLENSDIVVEQPLKEKNKKDMVHIAGTPWFISLDKINLKQNSVHYDIQGAPRKKEFDQNHFQIEGLTLQAEHLFYSKNLISADIHHTSFREHSGIGLRELSGRIVIDSLQTRLIDFSVETGASRIHQNTTISYPSFSTIKENPGAIKVNAVIDDSRIALSDMFFFYPSLPVKNREGSSFQLSSKVSGSVHDLQIEAFRIAIDDSAAIDLSGSIRGLPKAATSFYNINVQVRSSGENRFQSFLPDTLLPKRIVLPASIRMNAKMIGTLEDFSSKVVLATNIGRVNGKAEVVSDKGSTVRRWNTKIEVDEFNVGSLLADTATFGTVSMHATAAGSGITKDDIEAELHLQVDNAKLLGYRYRNLSVDGTANQSAFEGKAEIRDSNIVFLFDGIVNTSEKDPTFKFTFDLKGADLHQLHLASDHIRVSGMVASNLTGRDIDTVNGTLDVRDVVIIKNNKRYTIDSLVFASIHNLGQTHISLESTLFAAQFDGTVSPGELPEVLKEHLSHYFALQRNIIKQNLQSQAFAFKITLRDPSTLTEIFFPALKDLTVGNIAGNFNNDLKSLNISIDIPAFDYNAIEIDSAVLRITSNKDRLQASVKIGSIADSTLQVTNVEMTGNAEHDSIDIAVQSTRGDGYVKMFLAGILKSVNGGYTFRFNNNGIVFQNIQWIVPSDNFLSFGKDRLVAHNIRFRNGGAAVSLSSIDESVQLSPLKIEFIDFDVTTLAQIVERENGLLGGVLHGDVILQNLGKKMSFISDISITDVIFDQQRIGNITFHADTKTENLYELNMNVAGNGNQIDMHGNYRSREGGNVIDLTCNFTAVNLASIEPFTFGSLRRLSGTMSGGLHVTGTLKDPGISGNLNFKNTSFTPTVLDSYLHLNDASIMIDSKGFEFQSFDLVDTLGNSASLSGHVFTEDFRNYSYDVRIRTNNFLLLNKQESRDALFYGTVFLNSDISLKGDKKKQVVVMQAELAKGTNLALKLPESEVVLEERRGIVRFVSKRSALTTIMSRRDSIVKRDTAETRISSMDITSNITVDKDSKLRILIDPIAGDSLVIQGDAALSFTMDPNGKLTLTGRYEIIKGSYQLSFGDFIRKEFAIAKGSSLTWLGSPFDADVDITAIYTVQTTVFDLLQNQLTGISQEERIKYKQEIPIQVYLIMKGKLLTPNIHFKLDLPPETRGILNGTVYAKLNELNGMESELNKQVFALLILGRFIAESPLTSLSGNGGLSDFARSSASQILSSQLNRLSEQYIKGVSLNVGVDSYQDYSTGNAEGRTQLKLALSKQLFGERVTVQAGGNIDVEGQRSKENSLNNFAGDLKVLYKLTEDGRWQLQVFRQNSYEGAIDGDITKTGAGVVFTLDFDKLFGITLKPVVSGEKK